MPWGSSGSFGLVGFTREGPKGRRVHSRSLGSWAHTGGRQVHSGSLGSLRGNLASFGFVGFIRALPEVVGFIRVLWVQPGAP